ncbi:MAG: hypothetical protein H6Q70_2675 [Firmicutes bacterium]|nr:hypothetical protein [Bacillota bacterium]
MATVGQKLAAPEAGWKRYDDTDSNIKYIGTWGVDSTNSQFINGAEHITGTIGASIKFNFIGTKMRIISDRNTNRTDEKISVYIDGILVGTYTTYGSISSLILQFEKIDLENKTHSVEIINGNGGSGNNYLTLDAIDIDETGKLLPSSSIPAPIDLVATAGDSQVTLSWTAVDGATGYNVKRSTTAGGPYTTIASNVSGTTYVDTSVTNGTTYYYVVTAVNVDGESNNSNEASAKPEGIELLRVTMLDSSEREYRVSTAEIDGFVNWYTRTIGTGSSCYALKDIVDNSKEYLAFEKIISFKVIPLGN